MGSRCGAASGRHGSVRGLVGPAALALGLGLGATAPRAWAADGVAGGPRHPVGSAIPAPGGVPSGYVFTHHGWFDPSCVVRVGEDEVIGADLIIRGRADGAARFAVAPCSYPRLDGRGRTLAPSIHATAGLTVHATVTVPADATYDGYIVYYEYDGSIGVGPTLVTEETVPPPPTDVADQDIAFFNDILTSAGDGDILQPVLDFNGETRGKWSIESEHCCISGNDMQTTPIVVAPGDQIRGTVVGSDCASTGVCQAWTVTTADVTTGKSTTLNTTAPDGVPNGVSPASLETYGVSACDMFPAGGETTFTGNTLTDASGDTQTLKYRLLELDDVAAEVPTNCGYNGTTSGDDFTLIYGTVPDHDGGVPTGGQSGAGGSSSAGGRSGIGAAGVGGSGAAGNNGKGGHAGGSGGAASASGGGSGTSSTGSGGASGAGSGGTSGAASGGVSGAGDASGSGGSRSGTGGTVAGTGGTVSTGTGGSSSPTTGGAPGESGSSGGCSCDAVGGGASMPALVVGAALLLGVARRRRARSA